MRFHSKHCFKHFGVHRYFDQEIENQICITFDDVNKAIEKAMINRKYSRPENIDSLEPPPEEIAQTAEI
ncbi:hypothetical protein QR98_0081790 [Sarcoptes scabiei]|uniref:Uncharacterized protein n=1 Tax=Sarcoptes scabiei TaxID=52283 RepID=A0A132AFL1_SARSC|nr:hypothetical protein QR98_0081790 [Sarcoptes scabiei]